MAKLFLSCGKVAVHRLLLFRLYGYPYFALIVRVGSVFGRINLELYVFAVFVLCALRKKFGYDSMVSFHERIWHFAFAGKHGISVFGNGNYIEVVVDFSSVIFHSDSQW